MVTVMVMMVMMAMMIMMILTIMMMMMMMMIMLTVVAMSLLLLAPLVVVVVVVFVVIVVIVAGGGDTDCDIGVVVTMRRVMKKTIVNIGHRHKRPQKHHRANTRILRMNNPKSSTPRQGSRKSDTTFDLRVQVELGVTGASGV